MHGTAVDDDMPDSRGAEPDRTIADRRPADHVRSDMNRRRFLAEIIILTVAGMIPAVGAPATPEPDVSDEVDLESVLRTMFPHDQVDQTLYLPAVTALGDAAARDVDVRNLLVEGLRALLPAVGGDWGGATEEQRTAALAGMEGTPFFSLLRQTMVFTFYANPEVWRIFGYEGDAWSFGGHLARGVNTIDWLPQVPWDQDQPTP